MPDCISTDIPLNLTKVANLGKARFHGELARSSCSLDQPTHPSRRVIVKYATVETSAMSQRVLRLPLAGKLVRSCG